MTAAGPFRIAQDQRGLDVRHFYFELVKALLPQVFFASFKLAKATVEKKNCEVAGKEDLQKPDHTRDALWCPGAGKCQRRRGERARKGKRGKRMSTRDHRFSACSSFLVLIDLPAKEVAVF